MQGPRRALVTVAVTVLLLLLSIGTASAHVHGITPLRCAGVGNANSGAEVADELAAESAADLFVGLVPANAGGAVGIGDGGFDTPACPAD